MLLGESERHLDLSRLSLRLAVTGDDNSRLILVAKSSGLADAVSGLLELDLLTLSVVHVNRDDSRGVLASVGKSLNVLNVRVDLLDRLKGGDFNSHVFYSLFLCPIRHCGEGAISVV